jgi:hypothetical protein
MPGSARDIGIGGNGAVWVVGTHARSGGYDIYRWSGTAWANVSGGAVRIAVDPKGNACIANDQRAIFRWDGGKWVGVPGGALALDIGANGKVWVIGSNQVLYQLEQSGWTGVPGNLTEIAVAPDGHRFNASMADKVLHLAHLGEKSKNRRSTRI